GGHSRIAWPAFEPTPGRRPARRGPQDLPSLLLRLRTDFRQRETDQPGIAGVGGDVATLAVGRGVVAAAAAAGRASQPAAAATLFWRADSDGHLGARLAGRTGRRHGIDGGDRRCDQSGGGPVLRRGNGGSVHGSDGALVAPPRSPAG